MTNRIRSIVLGSVAVGVVAAMLASPVARAFIPESNRTMREIARVNRSSGRSQALQLELTMRVGDRDPVARGQLISHPSGLARLELRGFSGRVDRYLLSGSELSGAKDGFRLDRPQPMLQPFFFLQPSSETTLRAALESFGVLSEAIGLAPCGEQDCFVIGDPRLSAPLPKPELDLALGDEPILGDPLADTVAVYDLATTEDALATPPEVDPLAALPADLEGPELLIPEDALLPRLWVDTEDLQVRRIDRASGVFTIFGPVVAFEKLRLPAWFEVHEPGAETIRFEVDRAVQVNAPPQAFSRKWLLAPIDPPESPPAAPAPGSTEPTRSP